MPNELEQLQNRVQALEKILDAIIHSDRYIFQKDIQIFDGRNIQVAKGTGTKIGTEATQKIGLFGVTPIVQASAITAPSGGSTIDTQARGAIGSIITALHNLGITA